MVLGSRVPEDEWDERFLRFLLITTSFALPTDARTGEPYIMIPMNDVALDGFCHVCFPVERPM